MSKPIPQSDASRFKDVFDVEMSEIAQRRPPDSDLSADAIRPELTGLALSGGGIRSATFCLGVLQAFNEHHWLSDFDYLSTVSGGGFIGSWWSAFLAREEREKDGLFFPSPEQIEPQREASYFERSRQHHDVADGSLSAGDDPLHHLRLFSNYLTPRKGLFSLDAWRAAAVATRNIFLTWLILLPLLFAVVLAARLYFVWEPRDMPSPQTATTKPAAATAPTTTNPTTATTTPITPTTTNTTSPTTKPDFDRKSSFDPFDALSKGLKKAQAKRDWAIAHDARAPMRVWWTDYVGKWEEKYQWAFKARAKYASKPLLLIAWWITWMTIAWLWQVRPKSSPRDYIMALSAWGVLILLALLLGWAATTNQPTQSQPSNSSPWPWAALYIAGTVMLTILMFGRRKKQLARYFEAKKRGPSGQHGQLDMESHSAVMRNRAVNIHAVLLPVWMVTLAVLLVGGFGYETFVYGWTAYGSPYLKATGWGTILASVFGALYTGLKGAPTGGGERDKKQRPSLVNQIIFAVAPILFLLLLILLGAWADHTLLRAVWKSGPELTDALTLAAAIGLVLCFGLAIWEMDCTKPDKRGAPSKPVKPLLIALLLVIAAATVAGLFWHRTRLMHHLGSSIATHNGYRLAGVHLIIITLGGLFACLATSVVEYRWGCGDNRRSKNLIWWTYIVLIAYGALGAIVEMTPHDKPALFRVLLMQGGVGLIVLSGTWVIALGWALNPNMLSLHEFFKSRLTRAYLGASNHSRGKTESEITDAVEGDDVPLDQLKNCQRRAPYHLINTTLNLAGGRDLATAQRSAAYFEMSKCFCGSLRTGYRPTSEWMEGRMTLGTAVTISGAAVSPNMGSLTPSAALAMLLTFLNVRLGFWAPTPNQPRWTEPFARLWPFYMLREFFSQTNDLSSYCYLTDGGHFDNTGVYSLIQRGCKCIVMVDCGADPDAHFSDVGTLIRRARIDFQAEINLNITRMTTKESQAKARVVVGTVKYAPAHMETLGREPKEITGFILWIKPAITAQHEPADVRQYKLENDDFPQQSTADQSFDEAQFESYRRLGQVAGQEAWQLCGKRNLRQALNDASTPPPNPA